MSSSYSSSVLLLSLVIIVVIIVLIITSIISDIIVVSCHQHDHYVICHYFAILIIILIITIHFGSIQKYHKLQLLNYYFPMCSLLLYCIVTCRYHFLSLPGAGSNALVCDRLLESLVRDGVRMDKDALVVVSPKLAQRDAGRLGESFMARLGCRFRS